MKIWLTLCLCAGLLTITCTPSPSAPERVTVQHVLIAFKGSIPKPEITRSQAEAEKLAKEIYDRARKGEDFDALVRQYTDDQHPGIYRLCNFGVTPAPDGKEYPRERMVKGFGDTCFSLEIGAAGLAVYHPQDCKYGWHIIKRLQ